MKGVFAKSVHGLAFFPGVPIFLTALLKLVISVGLAFACPSKLTCQADVLFGLSGESVFRPGAPGRFEGLIVCCSRLWHT